MVVRPPIASHFTSLEHALKHYFGYDQFRPGQQEIIASALEAQDGLVIMPTGGGKSLCFQLPALLRSGLTVVVSPLIALMQDQVQALQTNGIAATFLNSSVPASEAHARRNDVLNGQIKLLYVAPERLLSEPFLEFLALVQERVGIAGWAIDEAHCVSEWGHDFRPEYRQLGTVRQRFKQADGRDVPMLALTATATERVRQDILNQLQLVDPYIHVASFNRPNLYYEVRSKSNQKQAYADLFRQIQKTPGAGIVYCTSRKRVDEIAAKLKFDGISALPYHAGLGDQERQENQQRFIRDDARIMVATVAFGMGINKPDVRFVIHFDLPQNLEGYYQESGRAGRDGDPAHCTLFFSYADIKALERRIENKVDPVTNEPLEAEQRIATQQLRRMVNYAEALECRRIVQLGYFGETFPGHCGHCDNCRYPKPIEDWTIEAQKFLSCVARFAQKGQNYGMAYTIEVLRGAKDKRILQKGHDQLSTYGIGKERSVEEWRLLGRSLLHQGLMDETSDGYPVLKLNDLSWQVLRKQRPVMLAVDRAKPASEFVEASDNDTDAIEALLERLQVLRKRLADEQSVPPYVVFANSSLKLMAQRQPQTLQQFAQISGVGSRKLSLYGDAFIQLIREFRAEWGLPVVTSPTDPHPFTAATPVPDRAPNRAPDRHSSDPRFNEWASDARSFPSPDRRPGQPDEPSIAAPTAASYTQLQTLEMLQLGMKPPEIAEQRRLRLSTVVTHVAELMELGYAIDLAPLVQPERQEKILAAIQTVGPESLSALREHLGEVYGYDEIKLVRAWWRRET